MTTAEFRPTHVVPPGGLPTWEVPDTDRPTAPLDALLPVQLTDRLGDWGRVVCANGWTAWVDGRLLIAVPQRPPEAGSPTARTADPRPLLARAEEAVGRYRAAAGELADGRLDVESFHRRTRGLRVGMVVDGESMWLYDADHERWVYCDGRRLSGFAADRAPGESAAPEAPTGTPPDRADVRPEQADVRPEQAGARPEQAGVPEPAPEPPRPPAPDPDPAPEPIPTTQIPEPEPASEQAQPPEAAPAREPEAEPTPEPTPDPAPEPTRVVPVRPTPPSRPPPRGSAPPPTRVVRPVPGDTAGPEPASGPAGEGTDATRQASGPRAEPRARPGGDAP